MSRTYQNIPYLKDIRRNLRAQANTATEILWKYLRRKQLVYKFRREFSIGNVIADFYCHPARLVLELDGWTHDIEKTKNKDERKETFLENKGYFVLRIKNEEVFGDIEMLLRKIKKACDDRIATANETPLRASPLVGERANER